MTSTTALVICGALGREVKEIADRRGWEVDIYGLSALLHLYPTQIVEKLGDKLRALHGRYDRLVVVYGDCGTAGRLEPVLRETGAVQISGPHCYEMLAGAKRFQKVADDHLGTFFLTDWLVRNFEPAVIRGLGLPRCPTLRSIPSGTPAAVT